MKKRSCADDSGWTNDRFNNALSVDGYLVSDIASVKREIVFDEPRGTGVREFVPYFKALSKNLTWRG
jgi:hypothetical protein